MHDWWLLKSVNGTIWVIDEQTDTLLPSSVLLETIAGLLPDLLSRTWPDPWVRLFSFLGMEEFDIGSSDQITVFIALQS